MKKMKSKKSEGGRFLGKEGMNQEKLECKYEVPHAGGYKVLENALSELTSPQKIYGSGDVNTSRQISDSTGHEESNIASKPKSFSKED